MEFEDDRESSSVSMLNVDTKIFQSLRIRIILNVIVLNVWLIERFHLKKAMMNDEFLRFSKHIEVRL